MVGVQGSPFRVTLRDLGPTAMSQYHQIVSLMPSKFTNQRFRFAVDPEPLNLEPVNSYLYF